MTDPVLKAARELAEAMEAHERAYDAWDRGEISDAEQSAARDRFWQVREKFANTPPSSLAGLRAKIGELCDQNEGVTPEDYPAMLARNILADWTRLIGGEE